MLTVVVIIADRGQLTRTVHFVGKLALNRYIISILYPVLSELHTAFSQSINSVVSAEAGVGTLTI